MDVIYVAGPPDTWVSQHNRLWQAHLMRLALIALPFPVVRRIPAKIWAGTIIGDNFYNTETTGTARPRKYTHHFEDGDWRNSARLLENAR